MRTFKSSGFINSLSLESAKALFGQAFALGRKLFEGKLAENFLFLVGGALVGQLFAIAASPILTRIFSPKEFGMYGVIVSVSSILAVLSTLRYEMALVTEEDDRLANALQHLCFLLLSSWAILLVPIFLFVPTSMIPLSTPERLLIIPMFLCIGGFSVWDFRYNRERGYKELAGLQIIRRIGVVLFQIALGFFGIVSTGLPVGHCLGLLLSIIAAIYLSRRLKTMGFNPQGIRSAAKKHRDFAKYTAPQNLLSVVSQSLPVILLTFFYSAEIAGSFWFATRILQLPTTLVSVAIRQLFYREVFDYRSDARRVLRSYVRLTIGLSLIIIPCFAIVWFFGSYLFTTIFGDSWLLAGSYSKWVGLWAFAAFCNPVSSSLFMIYGKQKYGALAHLVITIIWLVIFAAGEFSKLPAILVVQLYCFAGLLFHVFMILGWIRYLASKINREENPQD